MVDNSNMPHPKCLGSHKNPGTEPITCEIPCTTHNVSLLPTDIHVVHYKSAFNLVGQLGSFWTACKSKPPQHLPTDATKKKTTHKGNPCTARTLRATFRLCSP